MQCVWPLRSGSSTALLAWMASEAFFGERPAATEIADNLLLRKENTCVYCTIQDSSLIFIQFTVIPDFTDAELQTIRDVLNQRYRKAVEIQLSDCEILLNQDDAEPLSCPTVFWYERNANFVVLKIGQFRYRSQFFYTPHEQFDTGIEEYTQLEDCVTTLLQVQSDHEREKT